MWSYSSLVWAGQRRPLSLRNVHWPWSRSQTADLTAAAAGPLGRPELALLELANQDIEGLVENASEVARRELVPEQRLGVAQLVMGLLADRDLQGVALRRKRRKSLRCTVFGAFGHRLPNTPRGVLLHHR